MIIKNIDRETDAGWEEYQKHRNYDSPLFTNIENKFDDWIETSNPAGEYKDKYFSEDAIYDKGEAILNAIEEIFNYMNENELNQIDTDSPDLDIECFFE